VAEQHDRPIAADLAATLTALAGKGREELLMAISQIDEPIVLAQLIGFASQEARARIEPRLNASTRSDAAAIWSLPEARALAAAGARIRLLRFQKLHHCSLALLASALFLFFGRDFSLLCHLLAPCEDGNNKTQPIRAEIIARCQMYSRRSALFPAYFGGPMSLKLRPS
jgi:hypothetical protein